MSLARYLALLLILLSTWVGPGLYGQAVPNWVGPKPHGQQQSRSKANLELLKGTSSGWSVTGDGLFWTDNSGESWREITPPHRAPTQLVAASFIDEERGWAVLSTRNYADDDTEISSQPRFDLAATADGGETWRTHEITIANVEQMTPLGGGGYLFFLDAQHGWMDLGTETGAHGGLLLSTADGGATWQVKADPGAGGPLVFVSDQVGWLLGTWDDALFVTRDGAASWQKISLPAKLNASTDEQLLFFSLPHFTDPKHASLEVEYSSPSSVRMVVFATEDGGATWKALGQQGSERPRSQVRETGAR